MAGNDDRQRVPAERLRHGARRGGLTKLARDARIGPHGAVGDARRRLEHGAVELAPREPQVERPLEPGAPALDVLQKISVQRLHLGTVQERLDPLVAADRKSTRLNSSHRCISYAVFCLKKKKAADTLPSACRTPCSTDREYRLHTV